MVTPWLHKMLPVKPARTCASPEQQALRWFEYDIACCALERLWLRGVIRHRYYTDGVVNAFMFFVMEVGT